MKTTTINAMKNTTKLLVVGFWMGLCLAHNPWWVSAIFLSIVAIAVVDRAFLRDRQTRRTVRLYLAWLKEEVKMAWLAASKDPDLLKDQEYKRGLQHALLVLTQGGHYSHAVSIGVEAVNRDDKKALEALVDEAHDDTGLIEALQKATGKKLSYLAYEF